MCRAIWFKRGIVGFPAASCFFCIGISPYPACRRALRRRTGVPFLKTPPHLERLSAMALQAKSAHIRKVALAATFHNGDDMIGIPQAFSGAQVPLGGSTEASGSAEMAKMSVGGDAVDTAKSTNAAIPFEHPFSKVARVGAKFPLVDAPIGTERDAARGNLQMAPTTEISSARTLFEFLPLNPTTGHCTLRAHKNRIEQECFSRSPAWKTFGHRSSIVSG